MLQSKLADICTNKIPQVSLGGKSECLMIEDPLSGPGKFSWCFATFNQRRGLCPFPSLPLIVSASNFFTFFIYELTGLHMAYSSFVFFSVPS